MFTSLLSHTYAHWIYMIMVLKHSTAQSQVFVGSIVKVSKPTSANEFVLLVTLYCHNCHSCSYNSCSSSGKALTRLRNAFMGIFDHSPRITCVRSDTGIG